MVTENEETVEEKPSTNNKKAQIFVFGGILLVLIIMSIASIMRAGGSGTKVYEEAEQGLRTNRLPDKKQNELFLSRFNKARETNLKGVDGSKQPEGETYEQMITRLKAELLNSQRETKSNYSDSLSGGSTVAKRTWQDDELDRVREARYDEYKLALGFSDKRVSSLGGGSSLKRSALDSELSRVDSEIEKAQLLREKYLSGKQETPSFGFEQNRLVGQTKSNSPNSSPLMGQKVLPIGTVIRAAIDQKVISDYPGSLRLQITHDVYDLARRHLLIPAGSICTAKSVLVSNVNEPIQSRVGYVIKNLRLPNGKIIDFSRQVALDAEGVAAVEGEVDRHLLAQFLGVAAYALISDGSSFSGSGNNEDETFSGQVGENSRSQFSPVAQKYLSLVPTITLNPGHPVRIFIDEEVYITPWSSLGMNFGG